MNKNSKPHTSDKLQLKKAPKAPIRSVLAKRLTGAVKVLLDGEDVTPEPLNPALNEATKGGTEIVTSIRKLDKNKSLTADAKLFTESTTRFHSELHKQQVFADTVFRQSYHTASLVDNIVIEPERKLTLSTDSSSKQDVAIDVAAVQTAFVKMPSHISLLLKETPTYFLLELPSKTVDKDSEEAAQVEIENSTYEYLTVGKGRNRKVVNAEVQTVQILKKTRTTEAEEVKRKHNEAFASEWDMYDSYGGAQQKLKQREDDEIADYTNKEDEDEELSKEDLDLLKLLRNDSFQEALCITERLLANNNFNAEQKRFRGLSDPDPHRKDIEYKYGLKLLWTFANKETSGKCVSALTWNEDNPDILAVGYGKFYYEDRANGMVLLWNIKNPVQPERNYKFEHPVTALHFSKKNPNLLGIGFYDGAVKILDVSCRNIRIIGRSGKDSPIFSPVWQVIWYQGSDYFRGTEQIITSSQDGRISFYRTQDNNDLIYEEIMRVSRPEGKLKGIETLKRCHVSGIPVKRHAAALVFRQHPANGSIYYIGTNEGTIHKCSRNHYHQHLDLFLAHEGPMYELKFSPFCNKLFMTCGDDWHVRIWADGISEPLFELNKDFQSIQSADWSPTHSTIIANVCGSNIYIWDIQRKIYHPQSITPSPTRCRNTVIKFTKSGRCISVGDIEGNVHIFSLEDMPFPAYFEDDLLYNSILRCLITRPDLIKKIQKSGKLKFNKSDFEKHF
ncbi:hypothetical protein PPYR_11948 [Photinus pyralis]|uniref:Dynein axonemal intermediate chain 4 n=1 Tax=Photinus pyralis TaxID=7054 RepID=A0A5N4ACU7_PHOPY|nr:WD repeat-containing protein 78-like [Photinus pyralis]KAB0795109.1 hypothetical protein PPYR_11948 [Photinus pyralis]